MNANINSHDNTNFKSSRGGWLVLPVYKVTQTCQDSGSNPARGDNQKK